MPGLGLHTAADDPPRWEPYDVNVDEAEQPHPPALPAWDRSTVLGAVVLALAVLVASRPPAASFEAEVKLRRRKQPPQRLLQAELRALAKSPGDQLRAKLRVGRHEWPEAEPGTSLWARDLVLLSTGCTAKACFVGAAGRWCRLPRWERRFDLWALMALHAASALCAHQYPGFFFAHFAPRRTAPHSLLLGAFACSSPWELLWLASTATGVGEQLQQRRALGRLGTLGLYLGCGVASSLGAALFRRGGSGAGGLLGASAYHALAAPRARHSVFGVEMGARAALGAQLVFASGGAVLQPGQRVAALVVHGAPALLGAALFAALEG